MIIAIDGPAGSGKSSTAKLVAEKLGIMHLDTGAMYRAITLKCLTQEIPVSDTETIANLVKNTVIEFSGVVPNVNVLLDGKDVSKEIRGDEVTKNVSDYCTIDAVRAELVEQQRKIGHSAHCVGEGRDLGTVVFPDADLKFFMVASVEERAKRRQKDFEKLGIEKSIEELAADIEERDYKDSSRSNSPLVKADDAEELDTTNMTLEEQVDFIAKKATHFL